jgi:exosome complex RNA-binding protein Csl4
MNRIAMFLAAMVASGAVAVAHGDFDHVRGTVTQISAQSITVQVSPKATKTFTLTGKTSIERGGQHATLQDLKVGERVVIDVTKNSADAALIRFGTVQKSQASGKETPTAAPKAAHEHP